MSDIKLGMRVKDVVSGFIGIATAKTEFLNGCERVCVCPGLDKDGKPQDDRYFDIQQLTIVDEDTDARKIAKVVEQAPPTARTGGDRPDHPNRSRSA